MTNLLSKTKQFVIKTICKDKNDLVHAKRTVYWVKKLKPDADETLIQRVKHLVIRHEEGGDEDQNILNDADCLAILEKKARRWITENPVEGKKRANFVFNRIKSEKAKQIAKKFYD